MKAQTEHERLRTLAHIEDALAVAERRHTPEQVAQAEWELLHPSAPAQAHLLLRTQQ